MGGYECIHRIYDFAVFFNKGEINTVLNLHFSANMLPGGLSLYPERH